MCDIYRIIYVLQQRFTDWTFCSLICSKNTSTICFQSTLFYPLTEQPAKQQSVRFQKWIFNRDCLAVKHQSPVACENCLHHLSTFCWICLQHSKLPDPIDHSIYWEKEGAQHRILRYPYGSIIWFRHHSLVRWKTHYK